MSLTAGEQYLIELINRGRLDPAAEAARYNLSLNAGLTRGAIDNSAKQVLAPNEKIEAAATKHSAWMLANDSFAHAGAGGSNAGDRMQDSGYTFTGSWGWRENLAWLGSTGGINLEKSIAQHHEGLYRSESHRVNTFAEGMREIGVGQVGGDFTYQGRTYQSSMVTEKFAVSGSDVFVTGVAYRDADRNHFYSIGEGQKGVWVKADGDSDTTATAGGYAVEVGKQSDMRVDVGIGSTRLASLEVDTRDGNVKLDIVTERDGTRVLELSGDATLVSGLRDAKLLGSADLSLSGNGSNNRLTGNDSDNALSGGGGRDALYGLDGRDNIDGGAGGDYIRGGDGNDNILGGDDCDNLYGDNGNDRILGGNSTDKIRGGTGNDLIYGQDGNDTLWGHEGNDRLKGGNGHDRLWGGEGRDLLDGSGGNDLMTGEADADRFVFSGGRDRVTDFTDNVDSVLIRKAFLDGDLSVSNILSHGEIVHGDAVFDFGNGNILVLDDVSNLQILANDLQIL